MFFKNVVAEAGADPSLTDQLDGKGWTPLEFMHEHRYYHKDGNGIGLKSLKKHETEVLNP